MTRIISRYRITVGYVVLTLAVILGAVLYDTFHQDVRIIQCVESRLIRCVDRLPEPRYTVEPGDTNRPSRLP